MSLATEVRRLDGARRRPVRTESYGTVVLRPLRGRRRPSAGWGTSTGAASAAVLAARRSLIAPFGALGGWEGPTTFGHPEAEATASNLDRTITSPTDGASFTLGALFDALRAAGVKPHANTRGTTEGGAENDEYLADRIWSALDAMAAEAAGGETTINPLECLGLAEGLYTRLWPSTDAGISEYGADGATGGFQDSMLTEVGDYIDMSGQVAWMKAGRLRRVKQCDALWACVFPSEEGDAALFQFGAMVEPPSDILTAMRAANDSDLDGGGYARLSASTALIVACLCFGVRLDLSIFNAGGGMQQNWSPADVNADEFVPIGSNIPSTLAWTDLTAGKPPWQEGLLLCSAEGWDSFYHDPDEIGAAPASDEAVQQTYQQYVLNIWPTEPSELVDASLTTPYLLACRRRKCLAMAAFASGIGEWLALVDGVLRTDLGFPAGLGAVVDTVDVGSELDQFFPVFTSDDVGEPEILAGALEAGRYMALLAGPIVERVPGMRFRIDLRTWQPTPARGGDDSYGEQLTWVRRVLAKGIMGEASRWAYLAAARAAAEAGRPSGNPDAVAWFAAEEAAGFQWPTSAVTPPIAGRLLHEVGVNWYHAFNTASDGRLPYGGYYATSQRTFQDIRILRSVVRSVHPFALTDVVVGEVGFPAVDPGAPAGDWSARYTGTTDMLQAAMLVRILATLLAARVYRAFPYTFNFGAVASSGSYPDNTFHSWLQFNSTGVHNDIDYADRTPYEQADDCWPRPAWFAIRRLAWLLSETGVDPTVALSVIVNDGNLTILRMTFPAGLSTGPDGTALTSTWRHGYLVWIDQYGSGSDSATMRFGFPDGTPAVPYELLPLFPEVEPSATTGPNGYNAGTTNYSWSFDAAKDPVDVVADPAFGPRAAETLTLTMLRCDPSTGVVAPLCILTNGRLGRLV